ncbi:hypothetical protein THIOM_002858 [Candidatus Thiomargarita nelsonii]|uniref:Uncharacterized protein n=1 Tax=Candidatus Thiomargarita nelsonii TaxID=1003181 RepID=A0A176S0A4_9GAMM|nr:hypothetical protein THIOM_002858 [Candidatus Thiomargarita nelsonii]
MCLRGAKHLINGFFQLLCLAFFLLNDFFYIAKFNTFNRNDFLQFLFIKQF